MKKGKKKSGKEKKNLNWQKKIGWLQKEKKEKWSSCRTSPILQNSYQPRWIISQMRTINFLTNLEKKVKFHIFHHFNDIKMSRNLKGETDET